MESLGQFSIHESAERPGHGHTSSMANIAPVNGAVPVPSRPPGVRGGHSRNSSSISGINGLARSPPNKNTTHVPCKFFRQGNCQAGAACPFDHSMEPEAPCKYFMKGNCKFGAKCALAHILPDGRRVNKPPNGYGQGPPSSRNPAYYGMPGDQMQMQMQQQPQQLNFSQQFPTQDEVYSAQLRARQAEQGHTVSPPGSNFGSPPHESRLPPTSPTLNGLSALDTPFPASFDSTSISLVAQHHKKFGASVPNSFGWGPLSATSSTTSTANQQAFGNLNSLARGQTNRLQQQRQQQQQQQQQQQYGSSPPSQQFAMSPHLAPIDTQPRRIMHSERRAGPSHISASMGARPPLGEFMHDERDEDDDQLAFEEDLVPHSLSELLTPAEKMRRFSRTEGGDSLGSRPALSTFGSPTDSKVGSPSHSSPSRYGALFARQRKEDDMPNASPFGHVGSPLRNSSGHKTLESGSPWSGPTSRLPKTGDTSPFMSSPPRAGGIGLISEQLRKTRISSSPRTEGDESAASLRPPAAPFRTVSGSSTASLGALGRIDRAMSNTSIGHERIEEEAGVFDMEDDEEEKEKHKRWSDIAANGGHESSVNLNGNGLGHGPAA